MIAEGLLIAFVFILALIFHEGAHAVQYRLITKRWPQKANLSIKRLGFNMDFKGLSNADKRIIYFSGVAWGLVPFMIIANVFRFSVFLILMCLYLVGCRKDIYSIFKLKGDKDGTQTS